jgi:hypothetical protein
MDNTFKYISLCWSLISVSILIFYKYFAQPAAGRDAVALGKAAEQRHICSQLVTQQPKSYRVAEYQYSIFNRSEMILNRNCLNFILSFR